MRMEQQLRSDRLLTAAAAGLSWVHVCESPMHVTVADS
jgi:hypothetical protein